MDKCNKTEISNSFPWDILFPDILWIVFWIAILFLSRKFIYQVINSLLNRLKHGAGMKIGSFELEGLKVAQGDKITNNHFIISKDENDIREKERTSIYTLHRGAMLTHKIFKSEKDGQLYDILIYIIPNKSSNLLQVTSVEYYFGKYWSKKTYTSTDRSNGFAIVTSAYGPFLCTAKINFNDGESSTVYRYIDFEMGNVAEIIKNKT